MPRPVAATAHGHSSLRARGGFDTTAATETHFIHSRTLPPQCYCLAPPRPTAQLWTNRSMTSKSAPLPPVLPPPLPGGPLQGLPCYGGQSQYMCRNIATIVACVISCLCMRAFLERCLPGRAANVSVLITMPSWNGNMCGSALLEGQCSCKSCKRAPHHFSVLHTTVLFTQSASPLLRDGVPGP